MSRRRKWYGWKKRTARTAEYATRWYRREIGDGWFEVCMDITVLRGGVVSSPEQEKP